MKRGHFLATATAAGAGAAPFAAGAQSRDPYKIGVTFPLTGPFAVNASEYLPALEFAVNETNLAGGIKGRPLALIVEDTQATPQGGVAAMRKVVQVDGVAVVMSVYTNVVTAQIPLADQLKVPLLSTIEAAGVATKGQYAYAHAPTVDLMVGPMSRYWRAKRYRRVFALLANNAFGQNVAVYVRKMAQTAGTDYGEAFFNLGDTDFRGVITRAKDARPDAIVVNGGGGADEATVIKQIRELGIGTQLFTTSNNFHARAWRDGVGPIAEGMIIGGLNVDATIGRDFVRQFRARLGYDPGYQPAEFYDLMKVVILAIERTGYASETIKNFVATLKDFPSVTGGRISMGEDHYTRPNVGLYLVKNGALTRIPT